MQRICLIQKRAVRAISRLTTRLSKPLFANLQIFDVFSIYSLQESSFMYLYHNDALPISFTQIFQTWNQIRFINIQPVILTLTDLIPVKQVLRNFSILFQGPRIWTSLPNNIKNTSTFNAFKRVIKSFLRVRQDAAPPPPISFRMVRP